jgi:hypothetical protein
MERLPTFWSVSPPTLIKCPRINKVPSFNAANVWMMREYADIMESTTGNSEDARKLRSEADEMAKAVMTLYEPDKGVWASVHRDDKRVEMRHCYDFATVGRFMATDLPRPFVTRWWTLFRRSC